MKQPSREITLVRDRDRAGWNTRLNEHKCSIAWNIILSLNGTCRRSRTECIGVKMLCTWEAHSAPFGTVLVTGIKTAFWDLKEEVLSKIRHCQTDQRESHGNMYWKWSSFVSPSAKRFTLSPTFLKKRMSSPIGMFAHKGITGRSIDSVYSLVFVIGMMGRGNSALERPHLPVVL